MHFLEKLNPEQREAVLHRDGPLLILAGAGSGKTMLARRLPGILPPLTVEESIEVTKVHSAAGESGGSLSRARPFRAPHHTISTSGFTLRAWMNEELMPWMTSGIGNEPM